MMNIPQRREGMTVRLHHYGSMFDVTYNVHPKTGRLFECFYAANGMIKHGSDVQALLTDACIAISKRLEHGESFEEIAASFGEDRAPGATSGPASSILGVIARAGIKLEKELAE